MFLDFFNFFYPWCFLVYLSSFEAARFRSTGQVNAVLASSLARPLQAVLSFSSLMTMTTMMMHLIFAVWMRMGGWWVGKTQKSLCHLKQIKALAPWSVYISDSLRDSEQLGPGLAGGHSRVLAFVVASSRLSLHIVFRGCRFGFCGLLGIYWVASSYTSLTSYNTKLFHPHSV